MAAELPVIASTASEIPSELEVMAAKFAVMAASASEIPSELAVMAAAAF